MSNTYDFPSETGRGDRALELHLKGVDSEAIATRLGYADVRQTNRAIRLAEQRRDKMTFSDILERRKKRDAAANAQSAFYESRKWLDLRYRVLKQRDACCQCCGARGSFDNALQIDHIKPRSKYPELEYDINNLQILCKQCNLGKSGWDETDWRSR